MIRLEMPLPIAVTEVVRTAYENFKNDQRYGFLDVLKKDYPWEMLNDFRSQLKINSQVAVVGIGGSSQGIKSYLQYIAPECLNQEYVFFDRIDESYLQNQLLRIKNIEKTQWFFISKSGSSTETMFILNSLLEKTKGKILNNKNQVFVFTENKDSILKNWSQKQNLITVHYPLNIEGRFSLFSFMSLYPLANILEDSAEMKRAADWVNNNEDLVLKLSQFYLNSFEQQKWISMFWLYSERLKEFGFWLEQLWAESLGKSKSPTSRVSTPFCCYGTNDQHSLLQQMEEGYADKSHLFLQIGRPNEDATYIKNWLDDSATYLNGYDLDKIMKLYCQATYESLQEQPRALMTLDDGSVSVGYALHITMSLVIGTLGQALNLDIYGQPGVEKSKALFKKML